MLHPLIPAAFAVSVPRQGGEVEAMRQTERSSNEPVTAAQLEALGGKWDRKREAYVFPDGSAGAFMKTKPVTKGTDKQFSHYSFVVVE